MIILAARLHTDKEVLAGCVRLYTPEETFPPFTPGEASWVEYPVDSACGALSFPPGWRWRVVANSDVRRSYLLKVEIDVVEYTLSMAMVEEP